MIEFKIIRQVAALSRAYLGVSYRLSCLTGQKLSKAVDENSSLSYRLGASPAIWDHSHTVLGYLLPDTSERAPP